MAMAMVMVMVLVLVIVMSIPFPAACIIAQECSSSRNPVIFNFGDSNSDTGGLAAAAGYLFGFPEGRAFFHQPTGRLCDGRLVIDFLCENIKTKYLSPYLDSLESDFSNGANFAIAGSSTLPRSTLFNLNVQVLQFLRFRNRSLSLSSKASKNIVGEEGFNNALYTIDIGQNDLASAFNDFPYAQVVIEKIPLFIAEIRDAMWAVYKAGGKNFWVHNTGPLGCLPERLATIKTNATDYDEYGCSKSLNNGAKTFNAELNALCEELRSQMKNATIVYVDMYSIKYGLIANSASYGFNKPLMVCCGHGGPPYNYDNNIRCGISGYNLCEAGERYISWDGVHYTEAANAIVASTMLSTTNYSTPPLHFNFFCTVP